MNKRILAITDIIMELKHFATDQNKIMNTKEFLLFAVWGHISNACRAIDRLDFVDSKQEDEENVAAKIVYIIIHGMEN